MKPASGNNLIGYEEEETDLEEESDKACNDEELKSIIEVNFFLQICFFNERSN